MNLIANPCNENKKALYLKAKDELCVFYVWDFIEMLCKQVYLPDDVLFDTAFWLFTESRHCEPAKLGIALMSFFSVECKPVSFTDKLSDWLIEMG